MSVVYSLEPFIAGVFSGNFHSQMRKPAVRGGAVPVFDADGNIDYVARVKLLRRLAPFLIIAAPGDADENLPAAFVGMMYMPIVAAAGLKSHVKNADLRGGERGEIAVPDEILRKSVVGLPYGEDHARGVFRFCIISGDVLVPDFFC